MAGRPWGGLFPHVEGEERARALADPGPSWQSWFYFSFAKVWTVLGFFIVDVFLLTYFGAPFDPAGLALSLPLALYAEILLYQYLWYRPGPPHDDAVAARAPARWLRPVPYGRWTPEADRVRAGLPPTPGTPATGRADGSTVDPSEFL
ncbi:MAG TPA: hypothetical protein VMH78_05580 [Thermoplasmata archaeon]|nr:hypothetical protein [Thermoplasmata archaeon]